MSVTSTFSPDITLVMEQGGQLTIRIDDLKKLLPDPKVKNQPTTLFDLGVIDGNGFFHLARPHAIGKSGQEYLINIPFGKAAKLRARADGFEFQNEFETALKDDGSSISVVFDSNRVDKRVLKLKVDKSK